MLSKIEDAAQPTKTVGRGKAKKSAKQRKSYSILRNNCGTASRPELDKHDPVTDDAVKTSYVAAQVEANMLNRVTSSLPFTLAAPPTASRLMSTALTLDDSP